MIKEKSSCHKAWQDFYYAPIIFVTPSVIIQKSFYQLHG